MMFFSRELPALQAAFRHLLQEVDGLL